MSASSQAACVWYVELRGPAAQTVLAQWLTTLAQQPGFLGAELQNSRQQPDLALVASRWARRHPDLSLPPGAKHWVFEVTLDLPPTGNQP